MAGKDQIRFISLIHMNRGIYFMGLKSIPFLLFFAGVAVVALILFLAIRQYAVVLLLPVYIIITKLRKESKKGNPDYIESYRRFEGAPKKLEDRVGVMKYLLKK